MEDVICIHGPQISDSKGFEMQAPFRERPLHTLSFHRLRSTCTDYLFCPV